jgi:hypothetical protein
MINGFAGNQSPTGTLNTLGLNQSYTTRQLPGNFDINGNTNYFQTIQKHDKLDSIFGGILIPKHEPAPTLGGKNQQLINGTLNGKLNKEEFARLAELLHKIEYLKAKQPPTKFEQMQIKMLEQQYAKDYNRFMNHDVKFIQDPKRGDNKEKYYHLYDQISGGRITPDDGIRGLIRDQDHARFRGFLDSWHRRHPKPEFPPYPHPHIPTPYPGPGIPGPIPGPQPYPPSPYPPSPYNPYPGQDPFTQQLLMMIIILKLMMMSQMFNGGGRYY